MGLRGWATLLAYKKTVRSRCQAAVELVTSDGLHRPRTRRTGVSHGLLVFQDLHLEKKIHFLILIERLREIDPGGSPYQRCVCH